MSTILGWLARIIKIGILEFLARIGWRAAAGIVFTVFVAFALLIVLTIVLVGLLF